MSEQLLLLQRRLNQLGAKLVDSSEEGSFEGLTYRVDTLVVQLISEYGSLRANVGVGGAFFPSSFWIAALDGEVVYPDPPVTKEDITRLAARLSELVERAANVSDIVVEMGNQYSRAMRERLQ